MSSRVTVTCDYVESDKIGMLMWKGTWIFVFWTL